MELEERKKLIGKRIKEMRDAAGLNQTQLASELSNGVKTDRGKSTISEYEHGKNLNLDNIHRIAEVLNNHIPCDENYLLGCQEHPDITTSWIAEQIPLSREAIESLKQLNTFNDESDNYRPKTLAHLIDEIIINIINPYIKNRLDDPRAYDYFVNGKDDIAEHVFRLMEEYNNYHFQMADSKYIDSYAIEGYSLRLALKIADIAKKAASKIGYDKAQDELAQIAALKESNPELYANIFG